MPRSKKRAHDQFRPLAEQMRVQGQMHEAWVQKAIDVIGIDKVIEVLIGRLGTEQLAEMTLARMTPAKRAAVIRRYNRICGVK